MKDLRYRSVFDIIGPVMIGQVALTLPELLESGKSYVVYLANSLIL